VLPHRFTRARRACTRHRTRAHPLRAIARARPRRFPRSRRAQGDASDRLSALRIPDSNARALSSPGAVTGRPSPFGAVVPMTLVPRLSPRAHPRDVAVARRPSRPKAGGRTPRGSGPLDADETGEARASRRAPHCSSHTTRGARRVVPGVRTEGKRLASLSPPSLPRAEVAFAIDARSRRPPRPTPRGPRERLTLRSVGDTFYRQVLRAPLAPKAGATTVPSSIVRRSRDEDRRAPIEPLSFHRARPARLRAGVRSQLGPRPPASCLARAFDPCGDRGRASHEPDSGLTTSAERRCTGHRPRDVWTPAAA
jgi:hypothetical protein